MRRIAFTAASVLVAALALAGSAQAAGGGANGYSLFGDAVLVHPSNNSPTAAQASYDGSASFGGVDFATPSGLTFSQLSNLSTDYQFTAGACGGGSPRLVATVRSGSTTGHISFYIGPPPSYTGCPPNVWTNTGNLASSANLVDTSQLPGGAFYDPYASAQAKYGSYRIHDLFVVVDGFSGVAQTAQFDNVMINSTTYTFERR